MKRAILSMYRMRCPMFYAVVVVLIANAVMGQFLPQGVARQGRLIAVFVALGLAAICVLLVLLVPRWLPTAPVHVVRAPVQGRWLGLNSPASRVPSHGVRAYGQSHAIDIVHEPLESPRPAFGGAAFRSSSAYPAFGLPVFAMIDGTVVRASGWRRDHRARSSWFGFFYLMVEGAIREIGGPGFVVGNHVTIRGDDGVYATVAHLRRGSLAVAVGDRVTTGMRVGDCGNSGNSSEPHVHAQLMDRASLWVAQGRPMSFAGVVLDDDPQPVDGLPGNGQHMTTHTIERE